MTEANLYQQLIPTISELLPILTTLINHLEFIQQDELQFILEFMHTILFIILDDMENKFGYRIYK